MSERERFGCPHCGNLKAQTKAKLEAMVDVTFDGDDPRNCVVDENFDKVDIEGVDDVDENEFECSSCGETFESPARIVDEKHPPYRVKVRVEFTAYERKNPGKNVWIEEVADIPRLHDQSLTFWIEARDDEAVRQLLDLLRKALPTTAEQVSGLMATVKNGGK